MSEQGHQCLQGHAGVDQGGGVGVSELVRCDVSQAGGLGCPVQFFPYCILGESFSVVGEQEIGRRSGAGMDHGAAG
jgi:hypothetical protein